MNVFVYRPGADANQNLKDWESLIKDLGKVDGRKLLEFDDSLTPEGDRRCEIPAGTWPMKDVIWVGFAPRPGAPRTRVDIPSGARFTNLRSIGGSITVVSRVFGAEGGVPPISDFGEPDQMHIGLDGGTSQFANLGDVPLFDIEDKRVFFFGPAVPNP